MLQRLKSLLWFWIVLGGLTVLRLVAAAMTPLMPDEAYYWLWAQHPAAGYYDHPPMVAWWIMLTGWVHHPLMVRLPFVMSFLPLCWLVWDAAKTLFDEAVARRAVLWLNACLLLSVGSVLATPDPPSVLMWTGGLWALARLLTSGKGRWWLVFGLFAGLGVEAKYTNLFLGVGVAAWMVLDKPARRWLLTPWPYLGALMAVVAMAPNLLWNMHHDWATIDKQFGRIGSGHLSLNFLIEFLLSQPLLLNPLVFAFVFIGAFAAFQTADSRLKLLVALPLPLLAYLLLHVFHDRIQGNWSAPIFPGLVLLGAVIANGIDDRRLLRARGLAAPLGIGLSVIVLVSLAAASRVTRVPPLSQDWRQVNQDITYRNYEHRDFSWVASTDYNTQGELAYYSDDPLASDSYHLYAMAERQRYPWQGLPPAGRALIVIRSDKDIDPAACFMDIRDADELSLSGGGSAKSRLHLYTGTLKAPDCDLKPDGLP